MWIATSNGHVEIVRWLCDAGAGNDMTRGGTGGSSESVLLGALRSQQHSVVLWLVLHGALNDSNGIFDRLFFEQELSCCPSQVESQVIEELAQSVTTLLSEHLCFESTVFTLMCRHDSRFSRLCGHESTLIPQIAEFLGVLSGITLCNALEVRLALYQSQKLAPPLGKKKS